MRPSNLPAAPLHRPGLSKAARWRLGVAAAVAWALTHAATAQDLPRQGGSLRPALTLQDALRTVPEHMAGYRRHVFYLPERADENQLQVELFGGMVVEWDNCNAPVLQGEVEQHSLRGVGHTYWVFKSDGRIIRTAMGCWPIPDHGQTFAAIASPRLDYNSRLPVVAFVPEAMTLRYRVLTLGPLQTVPER
ncbi:ecotin family protein [Ottowia sp. SB7-C50]|uniref:ecotin family protein n=1 Tax=Ottowia sp. SB7-C50 TaxID=3081231 RepID=UPI0029534D3A|nr:ecotin family protein [Ottowia sp. SB7-C50]WOP15705.1 ecotin family protein [Ottowia sp. SB7-C50]